MNSKRVRGVKTLQLCLLFLLPLGYSFPQEMPVKNSCTVSGRVFDVLVNDAIVAGMDVTFSSDSFKKTVREMDGKYEVALQHGTYQISVSRPVVQPEYARSQLYVDCQSDIIINIYPFPAKSPGGPNFKFDFVSIPGTNEQVKVVISYLSKKRQRKSTCYEFALLTYDSFTVFADRVTADDGKTINVKWIRWMEDGRTRKVFPPGTSGVIRFDNHSLSLVPR